MAGKKREYSAYQKKLIKRYYENRDAIDTQRLQLVLRADLPEPRVPEDSDELRRFGGSPCWPNCCWSCC